MCKAFLACAKPSNTSKDFHHVVHEAVISYVVGLFCTFKHVLSYGWQNKPALKQYIVFFSLDLSRKLYTTACLLHSIIHICQHRLRHVLGKKKKTLLTHWQTDVRAVNMHLGQRRHCPCWWVWDSRSSKFSKIKIKPILYRNDIPIFSLRFRTRATCKIHVMFISVIYITVYTKPSEMICL